jgi:hypothetical protein
LGHKNTERYFSSGGNIEEIGHESNLSANVAFPDSFNLSLPDHVHGLISTDGPPRRKDDFALVMTPFEWIGFGHSRLPV